MFAGIVLGIVYGNIKERGEFFVSIKNFYYWLRMKIHWKIYRVIEPESYKKYPSYKHYLKIGNVNNPNRKFFFYTEKPREAGNIGHTMNNWIAGVMFARKFGCNYAYYPFQDTYVPYVANKWDYLLGFGYDEISVEYLLHNGYKKVQLPKFDENKAEEVERTQRIIDSYTGQKIVFFAEQDQFFRNQYEASDIIKKKYFISEARKKDNILFEKEYINIAVHIRRTVIADTGVKYEDENARKLRWTGVEYFLNVMKQVDSAVIGKKRYYIFTTGEKSEFDVLTNSVGSEVVFCNNLNEYDSFVNMVRADILITSKSSFSYNAALLSNGIKIVPLGFWHGYPNDSNWIIANQDGHIETEQKKYLKNFTRKS